MYRHGEMAASQELAAIFSRRLDRSDPTWAARFRILEAQSAAWRGLNQEVLTALTKGFPAVTDPDIQIRRTSLIGLAWAHLHQFEQADRQLAHVEILCNALDHGACSYAFASLGGLAVERGQYQDAFRLYSQSLVLARKFRSPFDESMALMDLAGTCLHQEHFDEAIDWMRASNSIADKLGAQDILLNNMGNLGWAYYKLGDPEKALSLFQDAEQRAIKLGDTDSVIAWLTTSGRVYQDSRELPRAMDSYRRALEMALAINSKEKAIGLLELLAHLSIDEGKLDQASIYISQLQPMIEVNKNRVDSLIVNFAGGRIAAARRQDQQAEEIFHEMEADAQSQASMRIGAEHDSASLFEQEGKIGNADRMYRKGSMRALNLLAINLKTKTRSFPTSPTRPESMTITSTSS